MSKVRKEHLVSTNGDDHAICGYDVQAWGWALSIDAFSNCPTFQGEEGKKIRELTLNHPNMCKNCAKIYMARKKKESVK